AQLAIAAELPLPAPPLGPAPYYRTWAAAASNGRGFLVVSNESRIRNGAFVMRADAAGHPLDRVMFRVPESEESISPVAVASDGDSYLIAYFASGDPSMILRFARVDDRGVVTTGDSIPTRGMVSLTWGGTSYVAAYFDPAIDAMDAAVISPDARLLRKDVALIRGAVYQSTVRVSAGPSGKVMVTASMRDGSVYANLARTDLLRDGTYFAPAVDPASSAIGEPSLAVSASSGTETLVVWSVIVRPVQPGFTLAVIRARRVGSDGAPLGAVFLVAYAGLSAARGAVLSISPANRVTTIAEVSVSNQSLPILDLAARQGGALFLWYDTQLNGAYLGETASEPRLFDPSSAAQDDPKIALCGNEYRAVWGERSNRSRIVFARVDARGVPLDPMATPIASDSGSWQSQPNIACNATNALVTWNERDLTGRNISARAALVDPDGTSHPSLDLGPATASPAVAWDGTSYLIAWQDADSREIHLARIDQQGQPVLVRVMRNARGTLGDASPSIAWNGAEYLVAWREETLTVHPQNYADPQTLHTIEAVRLSRDLTQLGAAREVSVRADANGADAAAPLAIAGEGGWLVAWRQRASFYPFTYSEYYALLSRNLENAGSPMLLGDPRYDPQPADGWFNGGVYRLMFGSALVSIGNVSVVTSGMGDVAAVSHG